MLGPNYSFSENSRLSGKNAIISESRGGND